jgi:DNA polymerase epsilon subunit 4
VPRTVPYKAIKEKKPAAGPSTNGESSNIEAGQTTLDGKKPLINGTNGIGGHARTGSLDETDDGAGGDPNAQLEMEIRGAGARLSAGSVGAVVNGQQDVEMS